MANGAVTSFPRARPLETISSRISPCLALFQNAKSSLTSNASLRAQPNQKCLRRFVPSENMPGMIQEY